MNNIPENLSTNYTFSSYTVDNFLYCIVEELINTVKILNLNVVVNVVIGLLIQIVMKKIL